MSDRPDQATTQQTEHAMMVAWGDFSRQHHLSEHLRQRVSIPRHHENIPAGDLVLEFGLLFLSGGTELQELNLGPRPLVKDQAVKDAWDLAFGHYTSVSRALKAATAETVAQVIGVLDEISRPFIDLEAQALAASQQELVLYADLSGRQVHPDSKSYPEARWGHMGDCLALGYQHALIALQGQKYRIHLAGFLHPGNTVSQPCLRELIQAAEMRLLCRPRRRVDLVKGRIASLEMRLAQYGTYLTQQEQCLQTELARQQDLKERWAGQLAILTDLEKEQGTNPVKPYSHLAKIRQQGQHLQRQVEQGPQRQEKIRHRIAYNQTMIDQLTPQRDRLLQWCAELEADNAANSNPVRIRIHLDGGFSGGDNLAYLIEMGYDFLTVGNGQTASALHQEEPADAVWKTITSQMSLWEAPAAPVGECPYLIRRILERWKKGDESGYTLHLQHPADAALPIEQVLPVYQERQQVEAANRQGKSVFGGRGVRIRSAAGLELLNQFTFVFWPNFVHWAADWLRTKVQSGSNQMEPVLQTVKTQVKVAAQTPAEVISESGSRVLAFSSIGPYPAVRLQLASINAVQLPLLLYQCAVPTRFVQPAPRSLLSAPGG